MLHSDLNCQYFYFTLEVLADFTVHSFIKHLFSLDLACHERLVKYGSITSVHAQMPLNSLKSDPCGRLQVLLTICCVSRLFFGVSSST